MISDLLRVLIPAVSYLASVYLLLICVQKLTQKAF
jgi:hypothetical protein